MKKSFDDSIVEDDPFLKLPPKVQLLYFHLMMKTDTEGFIRGTKYTSESVSGKNWKSDLQTLIDKGYIHMVSDNTYGDTYVIAHYWANMKRDTDLVGKNPTVFQDAKSKLIDDEEAKVYRIRQT